MTKVLIVRFSSIGDIVLTSPLVRCLKQQNPETELHYLTKKKFSAVLEHQPLIDKLFTISKEITEIIPQLKSEKYDFIIDLHNNLRSRRLSFVLGVKTFRFDKLNFEKWLLVNLKINKMPDIHIVDRYLASIKSLVSNCDNQGLDYFIGENDEQFGLKIKEEIGIKYHVLVLGGTYFTKQIPIEILKQIAEESKLPLVLLGGKEDIEKAKNLEKADIINLCGKTSLNESAAVIKYADCVITSDTGLMHIAAAFKRKIISLWGNTVHEFGMYPYFPENLKENNLMFEVKNLSCRPCSKLGYTSCPKKHFDCMMKQDIPQILEILNT